MHIHDAMQAEPRRPNYVRPIILNKFETIPVALAIVSCVQVLDRTLESGQANMQRNKM